MRFSAFGGTRRRNLFSVSRFIKNVFFLEKQFAFANDGNYLKPETEFKQEREWK